MTSRRLSKRIRRSSQKDVSTDDPTEPTNDSPNDRNISLIDSVNETSNNTANSTIETLKKGLTRNLNLATTVAKQIDEMERRHLDEINRMKQAHQTDFNELRQRLCVCEKCRISNDIIRHCKGCMRTRLDSIQQQKVMAFTKPSLADALFEMTPPPTPQSETDTSDDFIATTSDNIRVL